jgi:DNA-binding LacI/PurR family transcriptional regulator
MVKGRRRVTSQQVAVRAGVSRSTVSFVLNNVPNMSFTDETRKRVLEAAEELGYVPNAAAQMLVSGETRTIGLVVSHAEHFSVDAFIPQLLYSLSRDAHALGYRVLLETIEDVSQPNAYDDLVRGQRIDGLIVLNTRSDDSQLPELIRKNFPVVLLGFPEWAKLGERAGAIWTDGRASGRVATQHLINLGHSRIAHITFSPEYYHATQDRRLGWQDALATVGLNDAGLLEHGNYSAASGFMAMQKLLKRKQRPTALFAGNDTIAMGAMAAIHQHGLRIPEDIAVVGYDDIPTAPYMVPPLTTIHVSALEHGHEAVKSLNVLLQGERPSVLVKTLETPLVIRESCGAIAPKD